MFGIGMGEMIMIGLIGLLVFGNRLPGTMRSLGQSVVQFKKGLRDTQDEMEKAMDEGESKPAPKPITAAKTETKAETVPEVKTEFEKKA
jgi:sec-independent protein translocase protein TatA